MTTGGRIPAGRRSTRVAVAIVVALLLAGVWGHYDGRGASDPHNPRELVTTSTWSVCGQWPYFVVDSRGGRIQWVGLGVGVGVGVGVAITAFVLAVARTVLRRCSAAAGSTPR